MKTLIKSQVIECETVDGGGILVALGNDKFAKDFEEFADNDYCSTFNKDMFAIDCEVTNFFEFGEYEEIKEPSDLIGKSVYIHDGPHDGPPTCDGDTIINIQFIEDAEKYYNYSKGA